MTIEFECLENYKNTLREVSSILVMAAEFEDVNDNDKYVALNKSAILLLTSKFENFIETIVEEYIDRVNSMQLANNKVPEWLKVGHTIEIVDKLFDIKCKKDNYKKIELFKDIAVIWDDNRSIQMSVSNKFNYGKHGANELIKLFNNIGIEDIFKEITIPDLDENMLNDNNELDFKGIFNNITNKRNSIIHQDNNPNITHKEIEEYKNYFELFAENLCEYLQLQLNILEIVKSGELEVAVTKQLK